MTAPLQRHVHCRVRPFHVIGRRDFLRSAALAGAGLGLASWTDLVAARADELRKKGMACILLWMQGGPSQFETFSPKPGHENGGETKAIDTAAAGVRISENYPLLAKQMKDVAIVTSMTTKEGNHQRASFLMHTGYVPVASVKHPTLGSIAAHQIGDPAHDLPSFVRIGDRGRDFGAGGFLGAEYDPFVMQNPNALPNNTRLATEDQRFTKRLGLLGKLEADYAANGGAQEVAEHRKLYDKTAKMILSPHMEAFRIEKESDAIRDAYGRTNFGAGCLLARRLIETGVTFVEVTLNGWDTHDNNFARVKELSKQVDQPFARLLDDLRERGMLDRTLVVWMGEFGRTPKINPRGGRDHFPRAFNVALAGGGVKGGQVIGQTNAGGDAVTDRPVTVQDLFQSICKGLKINAAHENQTPIGRPIKIVDGGQPVAELFG